MVNRELYVSYGFSSVRRQQRRVRHAPNMSTSFICHFRDTRRQISRRPSLLVVRLLTSTLQVYLYISTLQNHICIYKTIPQMSAPTAIPALDEASKVRTILQKS